MLTYMEVVVNCQAKNDWFKIVKGIEVNKFKQNPTYYRTKLWRPIFGRGFVSKTITSQVFFSISVGPNPPRIGFIWNGSLGLNGYFAGDLAEHPYIVVARALLNKLAPLYLSYIFSKCSAINSCRREKQGESLILHQI